MSVITISRQYGSGGEEIATRVCALLSYSYFDKALMAQVALEAGLSESEIIDFSEDSHRVHGFLARLFGRSSPGVATRVSTWKEDTTGARIRESMPVDEAASLAYIQTMIREAHRHGNVVIVGRGGQVVLKGMPDTLHVRIEAPLQARIERVSRQENLSPAAAQERIAERDRAAADYLRRFYHVDWADPSLYDLVINMAKLNTEAAARLIAEAVNHLPVARAA